VKTLRSAVAQAGDNRHFAAMTNFEALESHISVPSRQRIELRQQIAALSGQIV